ncbi:hypothetical protein [Nitrosomonas sp. ANs5]|uniref:hypothetical protein n=1 Tax=Nitrosomonas sp. ANs5 TaxID=3423941 RepID=UPI003D328EC7
MDDNHNNQVKIIDINMPFWSMVKFMVKVAIASIPAFIILSVIGTIVFGLLGGFLGGPVRY